jgi:hypothetical protein
VLRCKATSLCRDTSWLSGARAAFLLGQGVCKGVATGSISTTMQNCIVLLV